MYDLLLLFNACTGQKYGFVVETYPLCPKLACSSLFCGSLILFVSHFLLQLLITYGDAGTKGALKDEHVFGSAKCQV